MSNLTEPSEAATKAACKILVEYGDADTPLDYSDTTTLACIIDSEFPKQEPNEDALEIARLVVAIAEEVKKHGETPVSRTARKSLNSKAAGFLEKYEP